MTAPSMSWSEVFTAIQQGTIDGQENGCSITKSAKMDEIQKYMTIWNYSGGVDDLPRLLVGGEGPGDGGYGDIRLLHHQVCQDG